MSLERLPSVLLRLEGFAVFGAGLALYLDLDYSLLALGVLFLTPDLSFLGYLAGLRIGAVSYNAAHTYAGPLVLAACGVLTDSAVATQVALIWAAHIGFDRLLGYGLKYPTSFKDTHLQRVYAMSKQNVDRLRAALEAYNQEGPEAIIALLDPEVEWIADRSDMGRVTYRGRDGVRKSFEELYRGVRQIGLRRRRDDRGGQPDRRPRSDERPRTLDGS